MGPFQGRPDCSTYGTSTPQKEHVRLFRRKREHYGALRPGDAGT